MAALPTASPEAPAYLVGGEQRTLASIAESIAWRLRVPVAHAPMPAEQQAIDIGSVLVDDSRFRQATGWRPEVGFEEGLDRTMESLRHRNGQND